ncbi:MAG: hypothetical protein KA113_15740 [Syntrophaceae bacterium]|nr:hypothetical protein [Syntrophaceae bacterium]
MPIEKHVFTVHLGDKLQSISDKELRAYAEKIGLHGIAESRYSWQFVIDLLLFHQVNGVDPYEILDEIRSLEGLRPSTGTKAPTQFTREPLIGFWHKHFFSARFVAHNIINELAGDKLSRLVEDVLDPNKSPIITKEMINELAHRVTVESLENRGRGGKLTGEWIVFAKHEEKNYYLTLCTHKVGDQALYERINKICFPQFPFLQRERI